MLYVWLNFTQALHTQLPCLKLLDKFAEKEEETNTDLGQLTRKDGVTSNQPMAWNPLLPPPNQAGRPVEWQVIKGKKRISLTESPEISPPIIDK